MIKQQDSTTSQDNFQVDQTSFSAEEPLYENASLPQEPVTNVSTAKSSKSFFKSKKFKIGAVVAAVFLLVLILLVAMMMNRGQQQQVLEPSPTPSSRPVTNDPIQLRINALSKSVLDADPADDEFPLPPIDLEITLEE